MKRVFILMLGAAFLISVLAAAACSSNDVSPGQKDNYTQPIAKKKGPGSLSDQ